MIETSLCFSVIKRCIQFSFLLFSCNVTFAQFDRKDPCRSETNWQQLSAQDPNAAQRRIDEELRISELINSNARLQDDVKYVIPVVIHVLYQTTSQNVSDDKIKVQMGQLNQDFANLNEGAPSASEPFGSVAADMGIEFRLAELDPKLKPTSGINRVSTNVSEFEPDGRMKFESEGGVNAWNPRKYLNIWVCNLGGGVAGYASFPSDLSEYPAYDGIVVDFRYFGRNRLVTHEVGHWLNLRHIWGDEECGNDHVSDTPIHEQPNYDCPKYPHNVDGPCNISVEGEMYMNFNGLCR